MPQRRSIPITAASNRYYAIPTADLAAGDAPVPGILSASILDRLLTQPMVLGDLAALSQAIQPRTSRSETFVNRNAITEAFRSRKWSLIAQPRVVSVVQFPDHEPLAEQILRAKPLRTWVEMEVVDELGVPISSQPYLCMLPDGTIIEGATDNSGRVRFDGIDPGNCVFSLTDFSPERWHRG